MQSRVSSAASLAIPCVGEQQLSLRLCCIHPHNRTCCRLSRQSCLNDLHKRLLYSGATLPFVALPGVSHGGRLHTNGRRGEVVGKQNTSLDEEEEVEEGGNRRKRQAKEKRRQILLEHGCRAGRMRKHAKKRQSRYKTDSRICRQTEEVLSAI